MKKERSAPGIGVADREIALYGNIENEIAAPALHPGLRLCCQRERV